MRLTVILVYSKVADGVGNGGEFLWDYNSGFSTGKGLRWIDINGYR